MGPIIKSDRNLIMISEVNDLYKALEHTTDIDERLRIMFDIATNLLNFDQKRAQQVANDISAISNKEDNNLGRVYYHSTLGRLHFKKSEYKECEVEFKKALECALPTNSLLDQAMCYDSLGILNSFLNRFHEAIEDCNQALAIYHQIDTSPSHRYQVVCHNNLGVAYRKLYMFDQAEEHFLKGIELVEKKEVGTMRFTLLNNLAKSKFRNGKYDDGFKLANEALRGFKQNDHKSGEANCMVTIAEYYLHTGKYALSLTHFLSTLKLLKTIDNKPAEIAAYRGLGDVYLKMEAYEEAHKHLTIAYDLARKAGDDQMLCEVYLAQGKVYDAEQKPEQATEVYNLGIALCRKRNLANMLLVFEDKLTNLSNK